MKYFPIHLLMGIGFAAVGLLIFINLRGKGRSPTPKEWLENHK